MDNARVWRVLSRKSRLLTAGLAVVLLAVPATAAASQASAVNAASLTSADAASCRGLPRTRPSRSAWLS